MLDQPHISVRQSTSAPSERRQSRAILVQLSKLSCFELEMLEDDLNFYAFTGLASPGISKFEPFVEAAA